MHVDEELGWTSWELYNFVLIGLTNELIELGMSTDIKVTVLQLWARYLGKLEIAFISAKKKLIPKLARRYKKRSLQILLYYYEPLVFRDIRQFCKHEPLIKIFVLIRFRFPLSILLEIFKKIKFESSWKLELTLLRIIDNDSYFYIFL